MKDNLAARLGGWSTRHRATAIIGWLLFVVAAAAIGGMLGQQSMKPYEQGAGDSAAAQRILADAGITSPAGELVLVHSTTPNGWHQGAAAVTTAVRATGLAKNFQAPLAGKDPRDALIQFDMVGDPDTAPDRVQPILDAVNHTKATQPGLTIAEFGDASANKWFNDTVGGDFGHAEWTAVPLAIGILVVAFGALLAAVLPVLLALTAFIAANGLLAVASHAMHVDNNANSVMLLIGLAVGVDYCLFYLRRERDERAAGHDRATALRIAAATSGRSVLISGLTVLVAMAGMFFSGLLLFKGFAVATILVVLIAMVGSVTVLPALLSWVGDRIEFGRIPLLNRRRAAGRVSGKVLRPVLAKPGIFAVVAAGVLVALAIPALGMHTEKLSIDKQVPTNVPLAVAYQQISAAFPGSPSLADVVVTAPDITSPRIKAAITDFTTVATRTGEFGPSITSTVDHKHNIAQVYVALQGNGSDATSIHGLSTLRDNVIPATIGHVATAYVTGQLAFSVDFNTALRDGIVPVFLFVMGVTFLLMLVSFRSLTVAVTSILLNLLSVGAAYGVMVAVFQHGIGASLIGTHAVGAIESWLPMFVFVVLFGLSMDYHVFVVSRIKEAVDRGVPTKDAVAHGVKATAGAVTSAAVIMVAVFAVFGTLSLQDFKQLGVGLAVAILLDATLVRVVLLPSVMQLLGKRNWYLPRWLNWLPTMSHKDHAQPPVAAEPKVPVLARN
ncbi:MAG TPA: MMPL family transporter [Pseudonocardiaceae bacterium]|nr:MMPL family transporter [Pseudonocardiaceae bacterium]